MTHEFGNIPPLYLEIYLAACWIGWGCFFLWQECRREAFVSWGALLMGGFLMPPLMSVGAPVFLVVAALFFVLAGIEMALAWIGKKLWPALAVFGPIGRRLAILGNAVWRALSARAFSCNLQK